MSDFNNQIKSTIHVNFVIRLFIFIFILLFDYSMKYILFDQYLH